MFDAQPDAFLGDAANYAISLGVAGMALRWRSRAALAKGGTLVGFALWVLGSTAWHAGRPRVAAGLGSTTAERLRALDALEALGDNCLNPAVEAGQNPLKLDCKAPSISM